MIRRYVAGVILSAAFAAAAATSSRAADIVLDCHVEANQPDHGLTRWRRRIVVSPPTRTVRIFDDFGHGMTQRSEYAFVSMNLQRIVLEEHEGKISYIDRLSGEYVLRNTPRRFLLRGHCSRG
jgi:hypothetical protein